MSNKTRELPIYPVGGLVTVQDFEFFDLQAQRDNAWQELREIREALGVNPEESTADEVRRFVSQSIKIRNSLEWALARGESGYKWEQQDIDSIYAELYPNRVKS